MATWQPPIPKSAFVEAHKLGAGLALLGYCYDIVKRDGTVEMNLHDLCDMFETSYATVRRWWGAIKEMGIVTDADERGRGGVRARMTSDWLDWRHVGTVQEIGSNISALNETSSNMSLIPQEMRSKSRSEMSLIAEMRSGIGSNMSAQPNAYKVLISDQNPERVSVGTSSEDRDGTERANDLTHSLAVQVFFEFFPQQSLSAKEMRAISSTATDESAWRSTLELWSLNGHQPRVGNLLDRYKKVALEHQQPPPVRTNGHVSGKPPTTPARPSAKPFGAAADHSLRNGKL